MEIKLKKERIQNIKLVAAILFVIIAMAIVFFRVSKYEKEGEKHMPYNISKIIVISNASEYKKIESPETEEGTNEENTDNSIWSFDIIQTNDIYISIDKIPENIKKNEKIKSVSIENLKVDESPKKGKIMAFMPNSLEGDRYNYVDDYMFDNSLTYRSADSSNFKNLQISCNGGVIGFSLANVNLGKFQSGEDTEIRYDGTMLNKMGITNEDTKFNISFDLVIELDDGKKYSGNVKLHISCNGLVENGLSQAEINDFGNVIFKRKK